MVLSRRFTKSRLWDVCRAYDCTVFTLLGGMIPEIYSVPERPDAQATERLMTDPNTASHATVHRQRGRR